MKRTISTKQLERLTAKWEKKLAAENLAPIPDSKPWTFPGKSSLVIVPYPMDDFGNVIEPVSDEATASAYDTPQAELWRRIGIAANDLPPDYPYREFLIDWASDGNLSRAARDNRISRHVGRREVDRFCTAYTLPLEGKYVGAVSQADTFSDPCVKVNGKCSCPVTQLSKSVIKRLKYTPPAKS